MVGLIPKLLMDLVETTGGPDASHQVLRVAELPPERTYAINLVYADDEWRRLLASACSVLKLTPAAAEEAYADFFCKDAQTRWPTWFEMSSGAREFLLRQPKIHNGFASGVADEQARAAINDKFDIDEREDRIVIHYRSPNQLCGLYQALARRILSHYREDAVVSEVRCVKNGDDACEIHVEWTTAR